MKEEDLTGDFVAFVGVRRKHREEKITLLGPDN